MLFRSHKLACHTTEYFLALDRCSWTTRGVWGPSFSRVLLFSGSTAHFQIWKVWLCQMKNSNKIGGTIIEQDRDDVGGRGRYFFRVQITFPNIEIRVFINEKLR